MQNFVNYHLYQRHRVHFQMETGNCSIEGLLRNYNYALQEISRVGIVAIAAARMSLWCSRMLKAPVVLCSGWLEHLKAQAS